MRPGGIFLNGATACNFSGAETADQATPKSLPIRVPLDAEPSSWREPLVLPYLPSGQRLRIS